MKVAMYVWLAVSTIFLCAICQAESDGGPDRSLTQKALSERGDALSRGYTWLVPDRKMRYDVVAIDIHTGDDGEVAEKSTGLLQIECGKATAEQMEVACTPMPDLGEVINSKEEATSFLLHPERTLTLKYTVTALGRPQHVFTEAEMAPLAGGISRGPFYGRLFGGLHLALLELPGPDAERDALGCVKWVGHSQLGGAEREFTCEAWPVGNAMLITGEGEAEKYAAIFEGGRIKSGEYRVTIDDWTRIFRISENTAEISSTRPSTPEEIVSQIPAAVLNTPEERIDQNSLELVTRTVGEWMRLGQQEGKYKNPKNGMYTMVIPFECTFCGQKIPPVNIPERYKRPLRTAEERLEAVRAISKMKTEYLCPKCGKLAYMNEGVVMPQRVHTPPRE